MRVLHLYSGNLYGGVERLLATLGAHCGACPEMEPHFALSFEGRLADELRAADAPVHLLGEVRMRRPWTVWRARRRLRPLLRFGGFDAAVCHSAWSQAVFAPALRRARVPSAFWLHDAVTGDTPVERAARRHAPALAVCTSRFAAETLPRLYPDLHAEVVYGPVPAPTPGLVAERSAVRAELETSADAVVFVQASRMEPWKGQRLHLEALGRLREVDGWVCWLLGGAQRGHERAYWDELRALAERLGIADRVRFAGDRADVPRVLAAADAYCQPNQGTEPFGVAFVEALYAGLPVVATAMGGALEVVDESCGLLVPPDDADALADVLRMLMDDAPLRSRLGFAGPARARALCDPPAQMARLHSLLEEMVGRAG